MLQTEEALKHLGSCSKEAMRGTQNKLPMDSLTRPFGSPGIAPARAWILFAGTFYLVLLQRMGEPSRPSKAS
jgi:hypothetical protein